MRVYTSDESKMVDVGTGSIWISLYSTVLVAFTCEIKNSVPQAMQFLRTACCNANATGITAEQMKSIQNSLLELSPEKAVFDWRRPKQLPPWEGNIASTVTSCANLYTTADGQDLFTELIKLLEYSAEKKLDIVAG